MDGHYFRAHFPGQGFAGLRTDCSLRKDGTDLMGSAVFHQFRQLPGIGFSGSKYPFHTVLLQSEIPAQIRKSRMAGDEFFPRKALEFPFIGFFHLLQTADEFFSIGLILSCMVRVCLGQSLDNGLRFQPGAGRAQPGMGIILAMFPDFFLVFIGNGNYLLGSYDPDHIFVFRRPDHFLRPGFHAQSLLDKHASLAQRLHAFGGGLELMGFRPFRDQRSHFHPIPADGFRHFFHGIETGHHRQFPLTIFLRSRLSAASSQQHQKTRQQQK